MSKRATTKGNTPKEQSQKLRFQFKVIKELNKKITPKEIIKLRKEFRTSVIVRNIYSEVLNIKYTHLGIKG